MLGLVVGIVVGEFIISILATLLFVALLGSPNQSVNRKLAWQVSLFSIVTGVLEPGSLMPLAFGVHVPAILYAVVFGLADAVMIWQLVLMMRLRFNETSETNRQRGGDI